MMPFDDLNYNAAMKYDGLHDLLSEHKEDIQDYLAIFILLAWILFIVLAVCVVMWKIAGVFGLLFLGFVGAGIWAFRHCRKRVSQLDG